MGRPTKDDRIMFRLRADDRRRVEQAARALGLTLSEFCRFHVLRGADAVRPQEGA